MRHAKSDWPAGFDDHDRPLSARGHRDAAAAAAWFNRQTWQLDVAVVSSAKRTQETFSDMASDLTYALDEVDEPRIYEASTSEILDIIRQQTCESLLVVGHGPGVPRLAITLSQGEIPLELERRGNYPTCAISVLESEVPWSQWEPGVARFTDFVVPRANAESEDTD
jgi:phosphohistidine phosphatase